MKSLLVVAFTCLLAPQLLPSEPAKIPAPAPTFADVSYGDHPSQRFDVYIPAKAKGPVPFIFYIHGGGWVNGDKRKGIERFRAEVLDAGVGLVSINYRFLKDGKDAGLFPPVLAPLRDAARALQTVRSRAREFGLEPERVVASGESAGAFTALWLGLGDERADPAAIDPVARESTRVITISVNAAQTSIDPAQMRAWVGPELTYGPHAFGLPNNRGFEEFLRRREEFAPWFAQLSPAALLTPDDPPVFLGYDRGLEPTEPLQPYHTHSPRFGIGFKAEADRIGVACALSYPGLADRPEGTFITRAIAQLKTASVSLARTAKWHPGHYIFVGHSAITDAQLALPHFRGIQRCYSWTSLEPEFGRYDFSAIESDLARLAAHGKQLVIQIQYKAFGRDARQVPAYLAGPEYGGGVYRANSGSWNPVQWNDRVGERMEALFTALGRKFDAHPNVEAAVLPETAPSVQRLPQDGVEAFTMEKYVAALKRHMLALRRAFPNTAVIQYTNFPPAILPELTGYMKEIGVGMGGPDVYPRASDLLDPIKGAYRLYPGLAGTVPLGAAVQSPDYSVASWNRTAAFNKSADPNGVPVSGEDLQPIPTREHLQLAREKLHLNYLFWSASPKENFANVVRMLAEPDLAGDPAGGLQRTPPTLLRVPAEK